MNAIAKRPQPGDTVPAHVSSGGKTWEQNITLKDGSMVVSREDLELLGGGNADKGRYQLRLMIKMERDRTPFLGPSTRPTSVRWPTQADEPAMLDLLMADIAENAACVAPPNENRVMEHIQLCTRKKLGAGGVIDGKDGKLVGCVLLMPNQWWWSKQYFYQEVVLFVHPDHRKGTSHIQDLLQFQRWWVDEQSKGFGFQVYLLCGVLGVNHVREKTMLYRRKFRQVGTAFLYPSPFRSDRT